jgi:molybdenum cofactor cytidylyltransferase
MAALDEKYPVDNCAVIILAAGQSSRLGSPKQLLIYQNNTLLQHAINKAKQSRLGLVVVILGAGFDHIIKHIDREGIRIVKNDDWQAGISSSISLGIDALVNNDTEIDAAILMVCDQPYVTPALLGGLVKLQKETGKPIIASGYADTIGIPALFHKSFFKGLMELTGDTGAKKVMLQNKDLISVIHFPRGEIDIDTLNDYKTLKQ